MINKLTTSNKISLWSIFFSFRFRFFLLCVLFFLILRFLWIDFWISVFAGTHFKYSVLLNIARMILNNWYFKSRDYKCHPFKSRCWKPDVNDSWGHTWQPEAQLQNSVYSDKLRKQSLRSCWLLVKNNIRAIQLTGFTGPLWGLSFLFCLFSSLFLFLMKAVRFPRFIKLFNSSFIFQIQCIFFIYITDENIFSLVQKLCYVGIVPRFRNNGSSFPRSKISPPIHWMKHWHFCWAFTLASAVLQGIAFSFLFLYWILPVSTTEVVSCFCTTPRLASLGAARTSVFCFYTGNSQSLPPTVVFLIVWQHLQRST